MTKSETTGLLAEIEALRQEVARLELERSRLRQVIDTLPDYIYMKDLDSRFVVANRAVAQVMGAHHPDELLGKTDFDFYPQALAQQFYADDQAVLHTGQAQLYHEEPGLDTTTMHSKWVRTTKIPYHDAAGKVMGLIGIGHNITDLKQAQAMLLASEQRFRSLIDSLPQNIFGKDLEGRFIIANKMNCRTEGKTEAEILGKTDFDLHPSEHAKKYREDDQKVIASGQIFETLEEHITAGKSRYVQVIKAPLYNLTGQIVGILGMFWDVTEQHEMQLAVERSEATYRAVLNALVEGIIVQDAAGQVVTCNRSAEQILGLSAAQFKGYGLLPADWVWIQEDGQVLPPALYPAYVTHQTGVPQRDVILGIQRPDHKTLWLLLNTQPLQDDTPVVITSLVDITRHKAVQQQALQLAIEKQHVQVLANFIEKSTHEFKTPLSIIGTSLYFLSTPATSGKEPYIQRIQQQVDYLTQLVDAMATLVRLDSTKDVAHDPVNLTSILHNVRSALQTEEQLKGIHLNLRLAPQLPLVNGDASQLMQAFEKLLHNALRYTPAGGEVEVEAFYDAQAVTIRIKDSGAGLSAAEIQQIFDHFYRGDKAHSTRGMGLGLTIAKRIVELHHGQIEVSSQPGQGSQFQVRLPLS